MEQATASVDIGALNAKIEQESAFVDLLTFEMNKVIVGQKQHRSSWACKQTLDHS